MPSCSCSTATTWCVRGHHLPSLPLQGQHARNEYGYTIFTEQPGEFEDFRYQVHSRLGELRQYEGDSPQVCLSHGPGQRGVRAESGSLYAIDSMNVFNVKERPVKDSEVCVYKAFSQHVLIFDVLRIMPNFAWKDKEELEEKQAHQGGQGWQFPKERFP